jgi:hypothetical protein
LRSRVERTEREERERKALAKVKKEEREKRAAGKGEWHLKRGACGLFLNSFFVAHMHFS